MLSTPPIAAACPQCGAPTTTRESVCPFCGAAPAAPTATPSHRPLSHTERDALLPAVTTGEGCVAVPFGLMFIVVPLLMAVLMNGGFVLPAIRGHLELQAIAASPAAARGEVVDRRIVPGDESDDHYYVSYRFAAAAANGEPASFAREAPVSFAVYERLAPGSSVGVTYAASDPAASRMDGENEPQSPLMIAGTFLGVNLFLLLFIGAGAAVVGHGRCQIRRADRLRREGQAAWAVVLDTWEEKDSDGDPVYRVAYAITAPVAGQVQTYRFWQALSSAEYRRIHAGQQLEARIVLSDPTLALATIPRG